MKIAFICVHNSCRSQIAEALAKVYFPNVNVYSAGTETKPVINQYAVRIMKDKYGIDMTKQYSKLIKDIPLCDIYISMGCISKFPNIKGGFTYDFNIEDPTGKEDEDFIKAIEEIKKKIMNLSFK